MACKSRYLLFKIKKVLKLQKSVIILGEFPPNTYTGISMVNQSVFEILTKSGFLVQKVDESVWQLGGISKTVRYLRNYAELIRKLRRKNIDVFYTNFPLSILGLMRLLFVSCFIKFKSSRIKIIAHVHRGDVMKFYGTSRFNALLFRLGVRRCSKIVVLSNKYKNEIEGLKLNANIVVLSNTSPFEKEALQIGNIYRREFLCISNFIETKGIEDLVNVFASDEFSNYNLTITGKIYEHSFFYKIKNKATKNIKFVIEPNRELIQTLLGDSDCFIMPSWNEGFPIVILEAMSVGLPIIATNVGSISEMLGEDYPFLVPPKNCAKIAEALINFNNYIDKKQLSVQLKNRYLEKFSNKLFEEGVVKLFSVNS